MSPSVLAPALGTAAVTLGRGAAAALGDGLSFASHLLRAASGAQTKTEAEQAATQHAQEELMRRIEELASRIERQLAAAGLTLVQPVELTSDGLGGIAVAGAHPQQPAIEEVLGSDVLLERDFKRLTDDFEAFLLNHQATDLPANLIVRIPAARTGVRFSNSDF